ncbi:hypothetical protein N658DRAFT_244850 [Parathielavia hyrcaniae]|uniref:Uncharacterized protein n=1 Tax=Parathielavia hyrcaniae TaxID=113614 RepID=A0AAN6T4X0_9PEZI|nr:hypothetical protein N658DRAFT_244850 [Parathielavia hyrcaniae]
MVRRHRFLACRCPMGRWRQLLTLVSLSVSISRRARPGRPAKVTGVCGCAVRTIRTYLHLSKPAPVSTSTPPRRSSESNNTSSYVRKEGNIKIFKFPVILSPTACDSDCA